MAFALPGIGSWYHDEVGYDPYFCHTDFNNREYAGERTLFDINSRTKRFSPEIGANWYHEEVGLEKPDNKILCFDVGSRGSFIDQGLTTRSSKKTALRLNKALPPIPIFHEDKAAVQDVPEIAPDSAVKSPTNALFDGRHPFAYLFADADEAEVTTIHDNDHGSLYLFSDTEEAEMTATHQNGHESLYMFSDADEAKVTTVHDNDHETLVLAELTDDEDDAASEDDGPATPAPVIQYGHHQQADGYNQAIDSNGIDFTGIDLSGEQTHAFIMAGIDITTTTLIENHILALGTNLAAPLHVDEEHEADKAQATDTFFNGPVEESPSPYHAPLIYETTGYGDIREGTEDFPELWNYSEPELKTITVEEANERFPATFDNVPDIIDTLAVEAPQPEVKPRLEIFGLADLAKARKAKQAAASTNVDVELESPVLIDLIDLTADEDASENASISKKRRAGSSFATKSTFNDGNHDDDLLYLCTKKIRVNSAKDDDEVLSVRPPSTYSLITQSDDDDVAVVNLVMYDDDDDDEVFTVGRPSTYSLITQTDDDDAAVGKPFPNPGLISQLSGVKSFKGQFKGLPTSEQAARAKKLNAPKVATYFGQAHHLNNLILHKDLHVCPTFATTEFDAISAPTDSDIGRSISYAYEKIDEAADMARSPAEEALRTEAYRECTTARLEGAAVGCYRYFQGHLTVEEYHERKMCICWQLCECSKMCTRFADLMCPCVDKLETNCH